MVYHDSLRNVKWMHLKLMDLNNKIVHFLKYSDLTDYLHVFSDYIIHEQFIFLHCFANGTHCLSKCRPELGLIMTLPMGRHVPTTPFWSSREHRHITRGIELMSAVSMCAVNVQEVLNALIDMRCLKLESYLSRISKIVTMGMFVVIVHTIFWIACLL